LLTNEIIYYYARIDPKDRELATPLLLMPAEPKARKIRATRENDPVSYDMHLILNTHWDREYRWSFRETQARLLEAGDLLVTTMEKDERFRYFHTDSQASFLEDYLEFRPENRSRVEELVAAGRILTGPWYTLPAEFLVSGESLVRNLLLGHRIAAGLGGVMKCAYNIFSWGQVSQLPQIYRQFGMDTILFYRGINQSKLKHLEFWWESPDGSRAMGLTFSSYHRLNFWIYVYNPFIRGSKSGSLPTGEYSLDEIKKKGGLFAKLADTYSTNDLNYHLLHQPVALDMTVALEGMTTLLNSVKDKASTRHLLFLQGFDQENPDPVVPDLIDKINAAIDYGKLKVSSLPEYVDLVRKEMSQSGADAALPSFQGEMLDVETHADALGPLYNGVFSARMPLKIRNADCQNRLERWAEPTSAWLLLQGLEYPGKLLDSAWREILQNQQHDGIGGCHVDRIQLAMEERYRIANDISECVTRDNLKALVSLINYAFVGAQELALTIFNSSLHPRHEVLEVEVDIPKSWGLRDHGPYKKPLLIEADDPKGAPTRCQILGTEDDTFYAYLKYGNAISIEATRIRLAIEVRVPACGYGVYRLRPRQAASRPVDDLSRETHTLENEFLRASIATDGSVSVLDKATGFSAENLNHFEDEGECGGPLAHIRPDRDARYTTHGEPARIALITNGPLVAKYRVERDWMLPESLDAERKIHVPHGAQWVDYGSLRRSERNRHIRIVTEVTLQKLGRCLEFKTRISNNCLDHRLRVLFPVGLEKAETCHVDSPFDVVTRKIAVPDSTGWYEEAARTLPTTSFVDVSDGTHGLAVFHDGLSEYEVIDQPKRTIALTLLRCFGTAGNPTETHVYQPLAQCLGEHQFRYAVFPHSGFWSSCHLLREANTFTTPLRAVVSTGNPSGKLPTSLAFFEWNTEDLVFSALKMAEKGRALILRGFNPTKKKLAVKLRVPGIIERAALVTLEEKEISILPVDAHHVSWTVRPGEITSLRLELRD